MEVLHYARRPFQYGPDPIANSLDLDQVFTLKGEPNDDRLVRLGFVAGVSPRATLVSCGICGNRFITDAALNHHGRRRHKGVRDGEIGDARRYSESDIASQTNSGRTQPADDVIGMEEGQVNAEEKRLEAERPIYWDKTQASIQAGETKAPEITTSPAKKRGRPRKDDVGR